MRIDLVGPAVKLLDVWMVMSLGKHTGDHSALLCHAHALLDAKLFDAIGQDGSRLPFPS